MFRMDKLIQRIKENPKTVRFEDIKKILDYLKEEGVSLNQMVIYLLSRCIGKTISA